MLECIKFILQYTAKFCAMLFTIDIGHGLSLGLIYCLMFIFLPVVYFVITLLKHNIIGELELINLEQESEKRRRKK